MAQQQNNNNPGFFDPKTLIAVAAVAIVYFGWQTYLGKKYPDYNKPKPAQTQTADTAATPGATTATTSSSGSTIESKSETVAPIQEQAFSFSNDKVSFKITNHGMGLHNYTVNNYDDKKGEKIKLGGTDNDGLYSMRMAGADKALVFNLTEKAPGSYVGVAQVGEMTVTREMNFDAEKSSFTNTISITKPSDEIKKGFSILIPEAIHEKGSQSFFMPSYDHQDFFVSHADDKHETVNFSNSKENVSKDFTNTQLISVSSQYFAAALMDKSEIMPEVKVTSNVEKKTALAELVYKPVQLKDSMKFESLFYAGPKSIDALKAVDPELAHIIDFGFFGFIARPLLYVMKAFHSMVGNWGFAIILLTLAVRFVVLPFNIMSAKSMKAMQKVQPIIAGLREKYKDDAMRLNTEMMAVMKQHGANPMSGCLPMLLQIPIFFALYRVIGSSIELYNSPFILWITDLSAHDKFYVLPVSMAIFMYIQQKITPSTMDPTQAKIMQFMPLVFSIFMLQLPAGLTLYMVVSTLFGIIQQYLIMRDPTATPAVKAVKAK
ncbi:membrane protein insertase YidC [Bdellovibrio sp. SKB1291214]|uniref:membrane protein insertase YidC n=1 Tax=Bdellovibrio sp. SKB1291214 TaxID=1732569 RepID=UPI000B51DEF6|nr:membrane protein insertase YidC [Bdellovibrio sp. SKB1291214]UYL10553.1 membrane protein insertase YidC [Bdellovibrio sp. SKB1291214]